MELKNNCFVCFVCGCFCVDCCGIIACPFGCSINYNGDVGCMCIVKAFRKETALLEEVLTEVTQQSLTEEHLRGE